MKFKLPNEYSIFISPEKVRKLETDYRKIPVLSPGLILIQTHFLGGLYSGELIIREAYNRRDFFVGRIIVFSFYFLFFRNEIQNGAAFSCLHV